MTKNLIAMVTPKEYEDAEKPVASQFEGEDGDSLRNSTFKTLIGRIIQDNVPRDRLQNKMVRCMELYLEEARDNAGSYIEIICFDDNANPISNASAPVEFRNDALGLEDRIEPYLIEKETNGNLYDVIDFMMDVKAYGGR